MATTSMGMLRAMYPERFPKNEKNIRVTCTSTTCKCEPRYFATPEGALASKFVNKHCSHPDRLILQEREGQGKPWITVPGVKFPNRYEDKVGLPLHGKEDA